VGFCQIFTQGKGVVDHPHHPLDHPLADEGFGWVLPAGWERSAVGVQNCPHMPALFPGFLESWSQAPHSGAFNACEAHGGPRDDDGGFRICGAYRGTERIIAGRDERCPPADSDREA